MAIYIRESLDANNIVVTDCEPIEVTEALKQTNPLNKVSPSSIMADIEGIHAGPTRNFTWYTDKALSGSVPSWTIPYQKPVIMHHNEETGKIIGRVLKTRYTDKNTRSKTGALIFTTNIPDKEGKEQIKDGRLKTTSIGATIHSATCSICNHDVAKYGKCEHERGGRYLVKQNDGSEKVETCFWMIHEMTAKELSFVVVPSDMYAHIIKIYEPNADQVLDAKESLAYNETNLELKENLTEGEKSMAKAKATSELETKEAKVIKEEGDLQSNIPETDPLATKEIEDNEKDKDKETSEEDDNKENEKDPEKDPEKDSEKDYEKLYKDELLKNSTLATKLEKALSDIESVRNDLTLKSADVIKVTQVKESLENDIINLNVQLKESLCDNINTYREVLGRELVTKESLTERSADSLNDSIADLKSEFGKSEFSVKEQVEPVAGGLNITEASKQTVVNTELDKKISSTDIKESANNSNNNIDLQKGLENLFSTIVGSRNKNY